MPNLKVLILALLLVIRFGGKDGNPMFLGSIDATFFGYGIVVGFSIGGVLFCALGGVAVMFDQGQSGRCRKV